MRKSKRWVIVFLMVVLLGIAGYMAISYHLNPLGYFTNEQDGFSYFPDDSVRAIKAKYLMRHKDEIDAVILGGSKAGAFDVDMLTDYTGYRYYNVYGNLGNFADYLRFTKFCVEEIGVREILLSLSSFETAAYDRSDRGTAYKVPAIFSGNRMKMLQEYLSYLLTDSGTLWSQVSGKKKPYGYADCLYDGRRSRLSNLIRFHSDPIQYTQASILSILPKRLQTLFDGVVSDPDVMEKNLEAMRQIKDICEQNNVKLTVLIAGSSMADRWKYENSDYYDYVTRLVNIVGEIWDFSDYHPINLNPYNFFDSNHFSLEVADLMIDTIFGKRTFLDFGHLLTPENVYSYMAQRKADFDRLREEYLATGTLALPGMEDESFLPWRERWISSKAGEAALGQYWDSLYDSVPVMEAETETDVES